VAAHHRPAAGDDVPGEPVDGDGVRRVRPRLVEQGQRALGQAGEPGRLAGVGQQPRPPLGLAGQARRALEGRGRTRRTPSPSTGSPGTSSPAAGR